VDLEAVTKEMRRHAKAINFGLIYGMSAFGLTRSTDLTLAEAENFVKTYFEKFPGIKKYLDGIANRPPARDTSKHCWGAGDISPRCRAGRTSR
jgi:DNA polymerase I-like protein with 3'-5' exonuclease and polymerase domains